jgi:hypothetical protein
VTERKGSKTRPPPRVAMHDLLISEGYRVVDDAWDDYGRRTYLHDDDAGRGYMAGLAKVLASVGWDRDRGKLREFRHPTTGEIIEVEPGGSETNGHFLHYMNEIATNAVDGGESS